MKYEEYINLSIENGSIVENNYLSTHKKRISKTLQMLSADNLSNMHILDIGPYLSYTPFYLNHLGNNVTVLEGISNELTEIGERYNKENISSKFVDISHEFFSNNNYKLPFEDNSFDIIICFETLEHFNFNPVLFLKELKRICKNDGNVYLTVPNFAKLDKRIKLLFGISPLEKIENYPRQLDETENFKYGLHWREYTLRELITLNQLCGFNISKAGYIHTYEDSKNNLKLFIRPIISIIVYFFKSFSSIVYLNLKS